MKEWEYQGRESERILRKIKRVREREKKRGYAKEINKRECQGREKEGISRKRKKGNIKGEKERKDRICREKRVRSICVSF